jgi:hypothetical protein
MLVSGYTEAHVLPEGSEQVARWAAGAELERPHAALAQSGARLKAAYVCAVAGRWKLKYAYNIMVNSPI